MLISQPIILRWFFNAILLRSRLARNRFIAGRRRIARFSGPWSLLVRLAELLADLIAWKDSGMPLIEQTVRLHHRAVFIHPFPQR